MQIETPTPFDEANVKDHFWKEEEWDEFLPSPGFITDFVLHLRGIMTPTSFCFWSGAFVISNILQRDAFLRWFPDPIFANFFIVFVAPPRICAKSTAVRFGEKLLYKYTDLLADNPRLVFLKEPRIYNRATPEGLNDILSPVEKLFEGDTKPLKRGSSCAIIVSELANFLGKQKYNAGLTEKLIDLYDCKDKHREMSRSHGVEMQEDTYVTLFGATTTEGLEESIPSIAMGGGFISRLIIDSNEKATRWSGHHRPRPVVGGPTQKDLLERMAWIAKNSQGEYVFSKEADAYYIQRYNEIGKLLQSEDNLKKRDLNQRYDIHLVKLAMLLRAQRYDPGEIISNRRFHTIELFDIQEADRILQRTFARNHEVFAEVGVTEYHKCLGRISKKIQESPGITRTELLRATTTYSNAELLSRVLFQLNEEKKLRIIKNGERTTQPSRYGKEKYFWHGRKG